MIYFRYSGNELYARMERAVEKVDQRLRKTVAVLEGAKIPYAIVGGHAVRGWVAQIEEAAVRNTRDVDVLVCSDDLPAVRKAMEAAGFFYRKATEVDKFVEHPDASARDAVHIVIAGAMVRPGELEPNPDVEPGVQVDQFRTLTFEQLVRMKLNSFRLKDRVHLLDVISLDMVDESWLSRFPDPLSDRLKLLLENPDS